MSLVNLFYLSPNNTGGWVTFTSNLIEAFQAVGIDVHLYKVGNRTEAKTRPFGYGKYYMNLSEEDAYDVTIHQPTLIVAAAKKFKPVTEEMLTLGAKIVVHDPTELKNLPDLDEDDCVVIRKAGLQMLPGATFIRHPYSRQISDPALETPIKEKLCVSTSRIDFDKNTTILLDANRILPDEMQIDIRGFENRLYTKFKVVPDYPEWEQSVNHYERTKEAAIEILKPALFMADMSIIKGDGGGTQYTFLEAWDAGAVPIIHMDWVMEGDDMVPGKNCLAVKGPETLAGILTAYCDHSPSYDENVRCRLRDAGFEQLKNHDPEIIGSQYAKFMGMK